MPDRKRKKANNAFYDGKLESPNPYLKTDKEHKDWYSAHYQGKQRTRPWAGAKPEKKKPKKK